MLLESLGRVSSASSFVDWRICLNPFLPTSSARWALAIQRSALPLRIRVPSWISGFLAGAYESQAHSHLVRSPFSSIGRDEPPAYERLEQAGCPSCSTSDPKCLQLDSRVANRYNTPHGTPRPLVCQFSWCCDCGTLKQVTAACFPARSSICRRQPQGHWGLTGQDTTEAARALIRGRAWLLVRDGRGGSEPDVGLSQVQGETFAVFSRP